MKKTSTTQLYKTLVFAGREDRCPPTSMNASTQVSMSHKSVTIDPYLYVLWQFCVIKITITAVTAVYHIFFLFKYHCPLSITQMPHPLLANITTIKMQE